MEFLSWMVDKKVLGVNVSLQLTIGEYWRFAENVLDQNDLQRKRVRAHGKTYQLLARDIKEGCVMPPIILATGGNVELSITESLQRCLNQGFVDEDSRGEMEIYVHQSIQDDDMIILDGLQRTLTIRDCISDVADEVEREALLNKNIRAEIFLGLNKTGILYRMLTLNTGQTPMSFRHQIEILYKGYIGNGRFEDGIEIYREADNQAARGLGTYKFSDVVDMFYAYTTGDSQSIDRPTLVSKLEELNFAEDYAPSDGEEFEHLVCSYTKFSRKLDDLAGNWNVSDARDDSGFILGRLIQRPFGESVQDMFKKIQPMVAFGAEVSRLMKGKHMQSISDIDQLIENIEFRSKPADDSLREMVAYLDEIASEAKKIGDAQRMFFRFSLRALFMTMSDSYLDLGRCWFEGYSTYTSLYAGRDQSDQ